MTYLMSKILNQIKTLPEITVSDYGVSPLTTQIHIQNYFGHKILFVLRIQVFYYISYDNAIA